MKIKNQTHPRVDTETIRAIAHAALKYVIETEGKIPTWGPQELVFHDYGTILDRDRLEVGLPHYRTAENLLVRVIAGLQAWGQHRALGRSDALKHIDDPILIASLLEGAGIAGGALPERVKSVPTPADVIHGKLASLARREKTWHSKAKRAATALKSIARERKNLERRLAKLGK